jgi:hypothetical protein
MSFSRNPTPGIWLMAAAVVAFAAQVGFPKHRSRERSTLMVIMIRYWVLAGLYALTLARKTA